MYNIKRFSISPSIITEIKLNIFLPSKKHKIDNFINEYENDYYKVKLKGNMLQQTHKDILDIILYFGNKEFDGQLKNNYFIRTISLYKIKEHLGYTNSNNTQWIKNKINEIQQTLIEITDKKNSKSWKFRIIDSAKHSKKLNTYVIIIDNLYFEFFKSSISLDYSYYLKHILNLNNAITKASIRYLLTHKNGHQINVNKLLLKLGFINKTERNLNKLRAKLLKELEEVKNIFNIELIKTTNDKRKNSDITIKYTRLPKVKFYYLK